jgi:hypothetical protein
MVCETRGDWGMGCWARHQEAGRWRYLEHRTHFVERNVDRTHRGNPSVMLLVLRWPRPLEGCNTQYDKSMRVLPSHPILLLSVSRAAAHPTFFILSLELPFFFVCDATSD